MSSFLILHSFFLPGERDFLVDCLALRDHMQLLDPVLGSPAICKV